MSQDEDRRPTAGSAADETEPARGTPSRSPEPANANGRRLIDAATRARLGRGLRLHYAEVLALPIPERLQTLIDGLAACPNTEAQR